MAASIEGPGLLETVIMGSKHHMYLYSHLGYGLMAGRGQILGATLRMGSSKSERGTSLSACPSTTCSPFISLSFYRPRHPGR